MGSGGARQWVLPSPLFSHPAPSSCLFGGDPVTTRLNPRPRNVKTEPSLLPTRVRSRTDSCLLWLPGPQRQAAETWLWFTPGPRLVKVPLSPHRGSWGSGRGRLSSPSGSPKFSSWTGAPSVPTEPSADLHCPGARGPVGLRIAPQPLRLGLLQAEGGEPHLQAPQPCVWSEQVSGSPFPGAGPASRPGPLSCGRRPAPRNSRDKQLVNNSVLARGNRGPSGSRVWAWER